MQRPVPTVRDLLTVGATAIACVVGGTGIGIALDNGFGTVPVFSLIGVAVGIVLACVTAYIQFRRFLSGESDRGKDDPGG